MRAASCRRSDMRCSRKSKDLPGVHSIGHAQPVMLHRHGFIEGCGGLRSGQSACRKLSQGIPGTEIQLLTGHALVVGSSDDGSPLSVNRYHFLQSEMPWPMANSENYPTNSSNSLC